MRGRYALRNNMELSFLKKACYRKSITRIYRSSCRFSAMPINSLRLLRERLSLHILTVVYRKINSVIVIV